MLQAGRSRVRVPMRSLYDFSLPNPSSRTRALGFTQPLTNEFQKIFLLGKVLSARKADNLTAIYEPTI
jgi:hypothetical protein